ncbi:histidine phosphatase family protein [Actinomycetospora atypica]|uniref:Histidine phosphatase family protein n=1 Tax=Actinomycetospora atypica TaxID=1290095 RepID=A0ABV9YQM1_9PSEU
MEMLLVRHGRPVSEHAADGGADPQLSEEGRRDAGLLAEYLASGMVPAPDAVWTSPMRRARETAGYLVDRMALPLRVDDRLAEFDAGAPSYVPVEEASDTEQAELWRALETGRWGAHRFDPDEFERRVRAAFDDVVGSGSGGVVAVVCHGGVINSYLGGLLARPRGMFCRLDYTSVSRVLASRRGHRQLGSLNETAHLRLVRPSGPG